MYTEEGLCVLRIDMFKWLIGIFVYRDGATSTRAAEQFNACFEAGERVFKEYGLAFAAASQHGRIIALNAMVLAGFPPHTPKHSRARTPAKPATHKAVEAIAASICDQFVIADTEEWFSTPVKKDEGELLPCNG